ncbi:MAG: permease, partial [Azonexus sp.]
MNPTLTAASERSKLIQWLVGIAVAASIWLFAYNQLTAFADWVISLLGLTRQTRTGEALHFFFYDSPKVVLLLTGIVFIMGIIQTFFSPERTRAMLSGKREGVGNVLAASLGIV